MHPTFFGGSDFDYGWGIAVDGAGRAHAVGSTRSPDLPLANPLQSELGGWSRRVSAVDCRQPRPADISNRVLVVPIPAVPLAGGLLRLQFMFVVNISSTPIATPVSVTFDGLTPDIFLVSTGLTFCPATNGVQFAAVGTPGAALAPGAVILTAVLFDRRISSLPLTYSSRSAGRVPDR